MEKGFIKLFRKLKNWEWYTHATTFRVFIHLLLSANWESKNYRGIEIKRGQVLKKQEDIALELRITDRKGKPKRQPIRTALNNLKSTGDITIQKTPIGSIITINNYNDYQHLTNNLTTNQPQINHTSNHKSTTTKEEKNIKNNNIYIFIKPSRSEVENYFKVLKSNADPKEFYDYFENNGWTINNRIMTNWKAVAKSWANLHNVQEMKDGI